MRRWREQPDKRQADAARNRATFHALWRLADLHREEFERLQDAERLVEGLPPIHTVKRGRPPRKGPSEPERR